VRGVCLFAGLGMVGGGEGDRVGGSGGAGVGVGAGQQFVDRSKVRILLCDGDATSSREVLRLLCNCSYQGQSNRFTPRTYSLSNPWDFPD
jgi:hypothetical protein